MATTGQDGLVGHLLDGRYQVHQRIARGGMATVYHATDRRLDRDVALKVMHPHLADDEAFVARFVREARAAARLSHPNVVQVFDQGEDGEVLYLAMEHLPGRTLRDVIVERGALTPREALSVILPVLDGLAAAHRAGIVHRDVKPENVILTDDGRVKVADFGLARAATALSGQATSVIGTAAYLAPEIVAHGEADTRSDVYAAGIMLFEMLTGRQPFGGREPMQVAYRHVNEDVPHLQELVPGLPTELDGAVAAATARNPADRPGTAGEWAQLVRRAEQALPEPVLDLRPVPGPTDPGDVAVGTGPAAAALNATAVLPPAGRLSQALPELAALRRARELAGRDDVPAAAVAADAIGHRRRRRGTVALVGVLALTAVLALVAWWAVGGAAPKMPDLSGRSVAELTTELTKQGLTGVAQPPEYNETVAKDQIIRTAPAAGEPLPTGKQVKYWLSLGTAARTLPKLVGLSLTLATDALTAANLQVGSTEQKYDDNSKAGTVLSSNPSTGAPVKAGDRVALVISRGPKPVPVNDVTGHDLEEATQILQQQGFTVDGGAQDWSTDVPAGKVISSDPPPGSPLAPGRTVKLVVSKGPQLVDLPNLEGRQIREVRQLMRQLGLKLEEHRFAGGIFGTVRLQDPAPGQVPAGSTVVVTIV